MPTETERSQSWGCPTSHEIATFIEHRLPETAEAALEAHIAACGRCRELVSALVCAHGAIDSSSSMAITVVAGSSGAPPDAPLEPLVAGTTIGRYTVLERIGAGGMGVVYAALDAELGRKVAIKVLRTEGSTASRRAELEARLMTEARAMAQLAHPNVVAVFEIGRFGDQVFLVMELVEGDTLREWLAQRRSWRAIVEVFAAAGQGLAAAHAAGLVHRDFKPANVLIGRDGRVRVTDFGLVQNTAHDDDRRAIAGTPRYMAPEQFRGDPADARTDQFSFCVALYGALYDRPPFAGETPSELADAVSAGLLRRAPVAQVPCGIARAVVRGLSPAPADRHGSMSELLSALQRDPHCRVRRAIAIAAAVAAIAGIAAPLRGPHDLPATCAESVQRGVTVWGPERREAVSRAFLASGKPFARAAFTDVERVLDDYENTLMDMRVDLREAARTGGPAENLIGLRTTCLDQRRSALRALVAALSNASAEMVQAAPRAVRELPDLRDCVDPRAPARRVLRRRHVGALRVGDPRKHVTGRRDPRAQSPVERLAR